MRMDRQPRRVAWIAAGIMLLGAVNANGGSQSAAATEGLRQKALRILRTTLDTEQRWIKVHAADALLALDYPQGVAEAFEPELAARGGEPEYRIGIWRVLAQAARGERQRARWIDKIRAAFLDTRGPDRLHAAETLAKLGYRAGARDADAFDLVARTGRGPLAANARWVLANSGRADGDIQLAELLDSNDAATRADAAYAMRYLQRLSLDAWGRLAAAVLKASADDGARVFLLSAAVVHAPAEQKARFKGELVKYAQAGTTDQTFEACAALAKAGQAEDVPLLSGLLDHRVADVRVGAAHALLSILKGR